MAFVVLYVMAIVIDGLAPNFSAQKNPQNALKLAVYSMTPVWVAGVSALIPGLGFLGNIGLLAGVVIIGLKTPGVSANATKMAIYMTLGWGVISALYLVITSKSQNKAMLPSAALPTPTE